VYESFYGLQERPFDLSPNPRFLFLSNSHREALTNLQYGLSGRPGLTVLLGEAGTGKTTIVRAALQSLTGASSQYVQLSNPTLTRQEFFEYLASGFGFGEGAAQSKTQFLREMEAALAAREKDHVVLALVIDEAQSLPRELLEEIRLLTNVESPSGQSLAVALVGQPELARRLNDPSLRQLKQRVSLRCMLTPLDLKETAAYIAGRIRVAGGNAADLFSRDAVCAVYEYSRGVPRTISVICDNALVSGLATDTRPVTREIVLEVCRDFEIANPEAAQQKSVRVGGFPGQQQAWSGNGNADSGSAPDDAYGQPRGDGHDAGRDRPGPRGTGPAPPDMTQRRRFSFF
jgi:general secretion pathway protein A